MHLFFWLLLLLASCQRNAQWQYHNIHETTSKTTRIHYRSHDPVQGIDIEMIKADGEMITYLQVHSQPIVPSEDCTEKALVKMVTNKKQKTFLASIHRGGQRVRLSEILQTELISSLAEGNPVTLELSGYRESVNPTYFKQVFGKLSEKSPSVLNRIKLY